MHGICLEWHRIGAMTVQRNTQSLVYNPAVYRIRVCGRLNPEWSKHLQGMKISIIQSDGRPTCTELCGLLPDQAALMGVLQELYEFGIPMCSVKCESGLPCIE